MSMHRKLTAILLSISLATSLLASCTTKETEETTKTTEKKETTEVVEHNSPDTDTSASSSSESSDPGSSDTSDTGSSDTSDSSTSESSDTSDNNARFQELSNRVIEAGKSVLGLQEADDGQKQDILTRFNASTELYERGAYYTITPEDLDILDSNFNRVPLNKYNVKNLTVLSKYVSLQAAFRAAVIEAVDERAAEEFFSEMMGLYGIYDKSTLEQESQKSNYKYYYDYPDDTRFVLIVQADHSVQPFVYYFIREGALITLVVYSDEPGNGFIEDCHDFMVAAGLEDMRALLDSSKPATDTSASTDDTDTTAGPADIEVEVNRISPDEFTSRLENRGFTVTEIASDEDNCITSLLAYSSDTTVALIYSLFASGPDAKEYFDDLIAQTRQAMSPDDDEYLIGSNVIIHSSEDSYTVCTYAEDMIIMAMSLGCEDSEAKDALKTLGIDLQ
ncbi:MAG: hypothetical protein J5750_08130 [Clostridiales bacterium]|nr:hypothetical protein [Clostridiales bacterium]